MALTIKFPEDSTFANNPILVTASSDLSKQFLKICLKCKVSIKASTVLWAREYSFSIATNNGDSINFELQSAAQSAISTYSQKVIETEGLTNMPSISMEMHLYEEYLENSEIIPKVKPTYENSPIVNKTSITVLPGGLSDVERYMMPANTAIKSIISKIKVLTRKPDGEIVDPDSLHIIPLAFGDIGSFLPVSVSAKIMDNKTTKSTATLSANSGKHSACYALKTSAEYLREKMHSVELSIDTCKSSTPKFYISKRDGDIFSFQFINSFGLLESISCCARPTLKYNMKTEEHTLVTDRTFTSVNSSFTTKEGSQAVYSLSSGYVNEEWADWWMNEFLTSNVAYMKTNGIFVPITIVPENKIKIYDRVKSELCRIDFEVKLPFSGSLIPKFTSK